MKILVNRKTKSLFCRVLFIFTVFTLLSAALAGLRLKNAAVCIGICSLCMSLLILLLLYRYFHEQNEIMEHAVMQIKDYISGNQNARIECYDEGQLYRLFHEVNSLVSILNAHAENEEKAKKFLKDTISDISHQLKTPLAALNIYNGIMQEEAGGLSAIKEFTDLSEQELDRIETLVQNLLKITKLDAGTMILEKKTENMSEMMDSIKQHFIYRAKQEEKLLCLSGDDNVVLSCDRSWLSEAISNIVKNAFDHTAAGNTISVEWKQFASMVQIIIKDNGSGIHKEDLHHIFKRFYRSRFSKDTQGIGLGLPLAKLIIEAHNGTIEVDSELGIGTVFTITFLIPTKL
ncbi:sensor histidine kinase [Anaerostipes sp.]|uniref:sensor histidine kinase n=1 Tax=Anaerostipes sp. TaxID=1872530 RepID=UPI0025BA6C09|nr:HAMP domain-containing sensor histidine kinase [Anaerostipes sp.]MBS7008129.1 HAMP domain-containing histidine kinase [Anaerostipes sp.]